MSEQMTTADLIAHMVGGASFANYVKREVTSGDSS
jgi:hypothetical protein